MQDHGNIDLQQKRNLISQKPCLDGSLPSSASNLRGAYHNPLPAKLVHTQKITSV